MKLTAVKIVTRNVDALAQFYRALTRTEAIGSEHYVEFAQGSTVLAICSQQASDLFSPGAATAAANRSLVISFEVADVDADAGGSSRSWTRLFRNPRTSRGATAR